MLMLGFLAAARMTRLIGESEQHVSSCCFDQYESRCSAAAAAAVHITCQEANSPADTPKSVDSDIDRHGCGRRDGVVKQMD